MVDTIYITASTLLAGRTLDVDPNFIEIRGANCPGQLRRDWPPRGRKGFLKQYAAKTENPYKRRGSGGERWH